MHTVRVSATKSPSATAPTTNAPFGPATKADVLIMANNFTNNSNLHIVSGFILVRGEFRWFNRFDHAQCTHITHTHSTHRKTISAQRRKLAHTRTSIGHSAPARLAQFNNNSSDFIVYVLSLHFFIGWSFMRFNQHKLIFRLWIIMSFGCAVAMNIERYEARQCAENNWKLRRININKSFNWVVNLLAWY